MSNGSGPSDVFFVNPQEGYDSDGNPKFDQQKVVAVTYLSINGEKVRDPNPGGSSRIWLYKRMGSDGLVDKTSRFRNISNYFVVPANFSIDDATAEAAEVNRRIELGDLISPIVGVEAGAVTMMDNFLPRHKEDLQGWGVPAHETDAIAKDAASWYLGYTTEHTMLPNDMAEVGGGVLNLLGHREKSPKGPKSDSHEISYSHFGVDAADAASFDAGVRAAKADEFHKAVLEVHKHEVRSFAPTFTGGKKKKPLAAGKQQADFEDAHSTILRFMNGSPALFKASSMMSQGDKFFDLLESFEHEEGLSKALRDVPPSPVPHPDVSAGTVAPTGNRSKIAPEDFDSLVRSIKYHAGGFHEAVRRGRSGSPTAFSPVEIAGQQELPSFAPGGQGAGRGVVPSARYAARTDDQAHQVNRRFTPPLNNVQTRMARTDGPLGEQGAVLANLGAPREVIDEAVLSRALSDLLDRRARLPPSGFTGVDPGLSPAWPGLKFVV